MKFLSYFLVVCFLHSCASASENNSMDKFIGLWETHNSESDMYEEWTKVNDSLMYGKSYVMNDGDTMIFERIELRKENKDVFYIPTVKDQNNNQPVRFQMTISNDTVFTFENNEHDFPKKITYRFVTDDSLVARLDGLQEGEIKKVELYFHRVK